MVKLHDNKLLINMLYIMYINLHTYRVFMKFITDASELLWFVLFCIGRLIYIYIYIYI